MAVTRALFSSVRYLSTSAEHLSTHRPRVTVCPAPCKVGGLLYLLFSLGFRPRHKYVILVQP